MHQIISLLQQLLKSINILLGFSFAPLLKVCPTTIFVTGLTTIDFNNLLNSTGGVVSLTGYNAITISSTNSTETIKHILNIPLQLTIVIYIATGKTITFDNKFDSATGYLLTGGSNFVGIGTNQDFIAVQNGQIGSSYIYGFGHNF